jgi:hypothetical protein
MMTGPYLELGLPDADVVEELPKESRELRVVVAGLPKHRPRRDAAEPRDESDAVSKKDVLESI